METNQGLLFRKEFEEMRSWGILLLLPMVLSAQPEFYGYFETEASTIQLGDNKYNFGFNKFRLDLEARPNDHVQVGVNINIQQYWGKTTWDIYDFIPVDDPTGQGLLITIPDTILLDNFYMKLSFEYADLTVGRQQISPGVGYAWNPVDIFNSKSLMDPSYEQTGVSALRLDIPLGDRSTLSGIVLPEDMLKESTQYYALKTSVGSFDVATIMAYESERDWMVPLLGRYDVTERNLLGASVIGEILNWGVWIEGAQNTLKLEMPPWSSYRPEDPEERFTEFVIGVDHTFDNSLYVLGEFLHNEFGVKKKADLSLYSYLYALEGETNSLMQDYTFLYLMHPTFDYVSLSAIAFANLNDNSGVFSPMLDWNVFEDTNLAIQGSLNWGEDNTEFGLQDWGLILNITSNF